MLEPVDYSSYSIFHPTTRKLMEKTSFEHGGKEYDDKYPDGIPTSIQITLKNGKTLDSKLIMYLYILDFFEYYEKKFVI